MNGQQSPRVKESETPLLGVGQVGFLEEPALEQASSPAWCQDPEGLTSLPRRVGGFVQEVAASGSLRRGSSGERPVTTREPQSPLA